MAQFQKEDLPLVKCDEFSPLLIRYRAIKSSKSSLKHGSEHGSSIYPLYKNHVLLTFCLLSWWDLHFLNSVESHFEPEFRGL